MTLRRGDRFRLNDLTFQVLYVNASRAHCVARTLASVRLMDRRTGVPRTFTATRTTTLDISPNAGVELLPRRSRRVEVSA